MLKQKDKHSKRYMQEKRKIIIRSYVIDANDKFSEDEEEKSEGYMGLFKLKL